MPDDHNDYNGSDSGEVKLTLPVRAPITRERKIRRVSVLRDPGYMEWLKEMPCVACMTATLPLPVLVGSDAQWRRIATIDPAHTLNNGRSSKGPDSSCIPLCRYHHDEMDGRLSTRVTTKIQFAVKYGLDLAEESAAHYSMYLLMKEKSGTV